MLLPSYEVLGHGMEHGEMKKELVAQGIHNLNREAGTKKKKKGTHKTKFHYLKTYFVTKY